MYRLCHRDERQSFWDVTLSELSGYSHHVALGNGKWMGHPHGKNGYKWRFVGTHNRTLEDLFMTRLDYQKTDHSG